MIRPCILMFASAFHLWAAPAVADIYALVIGVDKYQHLTDLNGAVNDALDIADAVNSLDPKELTVLLNEEVTREAIYKNWTSLAAKAKPGDTLLITYAGHGGTEDAPFSDEGDQRNENIQLSGFSPVGLAAAQRIRDDEIAQLIALRSDVSTIFVADSCHSGSVYRKTTGRARYSPVGEIIDDPLPRLRPSDLPEPSSGDASIFFGAVPETELVYEITEGAQVRGALSLAFAQGLRGAADQDGDGIIQKGEMESHVLRTVSRRTDGAQFPVIKPDGKQDATLFQISRADVAETEQVNPFNTPFEELQLVPLEIINAPDSIDDLYTALSGVERVLPPSERLTWEVDIGVLSSTRGEQLFRYENTDPDDIFRSISEVQRVIDKMRVTRHLRQLSLTRALSLSFKTGNGLYRDGQKIEIVLDERQHEYPVLFNLSSNGKIHFLYPDPEYKDRPKVRTSEAIEMTLWATRPFGADHLIAIETTKPSVQVMRAVSKRHRDTANVSALWTDLHHALRDTNADFAIFPYFTLGNP